MSDGFSPAGVAGAALTQCGFFYGPDVASGFDTSGRSRTPARCVAGGLVELFRSYDLPVPEQWPCDLAVAGCGSSRLPVPDVPGGLT